MRAIHPIVIVLFWPFLLLGALCRGAYEAFCAGAEIAQRAMEEWADSRR